MIDFTVAGRGEFPIDMLRYDQCWPADGNAASDILHSLRPGPLERREIKLRSAARQITPDRWSSFLWTVIKEN
jgi:hypothetical protein